MFITIQTSVVPTPDCKLGKKTPRIFLVFSEGFVTPETYVRNAKDVTKVGLLVEAVTNNGSENMSNFYPRPVRKPLGEHDGQLEHREFDFQTTKLSAHATAQFIEMVERRFPRVDEHRHTMLNERPVLQEVLTKLRTLHYLADKAGLTHLKKVILDAYVVAFEKIGPDAACEVLDGRKSNMGSMN